MRNTHERIAAGPFVQVADLLASLGGDRDRLWPGDRWPPMVLDRGTEPGSAGGHDRVRYSVEAAELSGPARWVTFRFAPHMGLVGTHRFDVEDLGDGRVRLRHVIDAQPIRSMRIGWPLVVRWLHDAVIEDAFDGAEAALAGVPLQRRELSPWVRALRSMARAAQARPEPELALRSRRAGADATTVTLVGIGALHAVWALGVRAVAGVLALRGESGLVVSALGIGKTTARFRARDLTFSSRCASRASGACDAPGPVAASTTVAPPAVAHTHGTGACGDPPHEECPTQRDPGREQRPPAGLRISPGDRSYRSVAWCPARWRRGRPVRRSRR